MLLWSWFNANTLWLTKSNQHAPMNSIFSPRRLLALCRKETFQILRDPSSNIIAFILPVVMLLIFGYGINLDSKGLRVGLVMEETSPEARLFAASLAGSPYLRITFS